MRFGTPALGDDVHLAPLHIAVDRGLLAAAGIELVELAGGTTAVAHALGADAIELGLGRTDGLIAAIVADASLRLVATAVETPLRAGRPPVSPGFMIAARVGALEKRAEAVRAALGVFREAVGIFERESAYAHALAIRRYGLPRDDAERWWSAVRYSPDGAISAGAITAAVETLRAAGVLDRLPDVAALIAPGFAPLRP